MAFIKTGETITKTVELTEWVCDVCQQPLGDRYPRFAIIRTMAKPTHYESYEQSFDVCSVVCLQRFANE